MRRIVKNIFEVRGQSSDTRYMHAGFKSYENRFEEMKRPCHCVEREAKRSRVVRSDIKRPGLFSQ